MLPRRMTLGGKPVGGCDFTRGHLYGMLRNVIYTGRIPHKGTVHPGQHDAIIDIATFEAAQAMLAGNVQGHRTRVRAASPSPLAGKIVDDAGEPLIATHANKGKVRHRYYVSHALHHGRSDTGMRLPAREIETLVVEQLTGLLADPLALATSSALDFNADDIGPLHRRCEALTGALRERRSPALQQLLRQIQVNPHAVTIVIDSAALASLLGSQQRADAAETITLGCPARLTRSGRTLRLVQDSGAVLAGTPDRALVRLLVQARQWWALLRTGEINTRSLAAREGVTPSHMTRVVRLAFLAPTVTDAILAGRQRAGVTVASLTLGDPLAADWQAQKALLLPAAARR